MRSIARSLAALVVTLSAVALPSLVDGVGSSARADIPPENSRGCSGKKLGDACEDDGGHGGACVQSRCGSARGPDYDCLLCDKAAAPAEASKPKSGCAAGEGGLAGLAIGAAVSVGAGRCGRRTSPSRALMG